MAHRAGALARGPAGPAHVLRGDGGVGLRRGWTMLGLGRRHCLGRQSVLAGAVPELHGHVPVPRGQLRAGRRRAGALHRGGVSVVHTRHSPHGGGIAPHEPGLPPSRDAGDPMTSLLQQWVTEQAERRPDATAVVMHGARLTYAELEALSNRLACTLKAAGCEQGDRVGLLLPKSPLAIVSMVGILKADCIYVPLDPSSPTPRVRKIVESAEPRVILADARAALRLRELLSDPRLRRAIAVGWMERERAGGEAFEPTFSLEDVVRAPSDPMDYRNNSTHPAHILFTSGSTGTPKGVMIAHRNVIHFVEWARRHFNLGATDRLSGHPPLHFDLSTFDVFGTFASGAQLHLVPPEINLLPNALAEFIRASELTQWFSVPSLLSYMAKFDVVQFNDFPSLRRLLWCGEVFPTPALRYWMARLPHATFTNLYGPTETTIEGDGLVYFLGRVDSQIKSGGYRIELGEIETALNSMSFLQECAVVAIPTDGFEGTVICCAYVPRPAVAITPAEIRKELAKVLPAPMLPSRWMAFERLPRNAHGKFDRRQRQEAFANNEAVAAEQR